MIHPQVILIGCIVLLLSLGGNVWLSHKVLSARAECAAKAETARLEGQVAALADRSDTLGMQVQLVTADRTELLGALNQINEEQAASVARLRRLIGELPTPTCAPGSARVDAWNSIGRGDP